MAASRPIRIARPRGNHPASKGPGAEATVVSPRSASTVPVGDRRPNVGGSQRVFRLTALFLVALVAIYVGFVLYDSTAPGGGATPQANGLLLFSVIFAVFAVAGVGITMTQAPRSILVAGDHVSVLGRWGGRRRLPPLERLSVRVVRKYPSGWLASEPVELVEVWSDESPVRSYLVSAGLFDGAASAPMVR